MNSWCPENDGAYRAEMSAREESYYAKLQKENKQLKQRLKYIEEKIADYNKLHAKELNLTISI